MKLGIFGFCCFLVGMILGGALERDELKSSLKKKPLIILLKKGKLTDTVKIEVDTFKYYQE